MVPRNTCCVDGLDDTIRDLLTGIFTAVKGMSEGFQPTEGKNQELVNF